MTCVCLWFCVNCVVCAVILLFYIQYIVLKSSVPPTTTRGHQHSPKNPKKTCVRWVCFLLYYTYPTPTWAITISLARNRTHEHHLTMGEYIYVCVHPWPYSNPYTGLTRRLDTNQTPLACRLKIIGRGRTAGRRGHAAAGSKSRHFCECSVVVVTINEWSLTIDILFNRDRH